MTLNQATLSDIRNIAIAKYDAKAVMWDGQTKARHVLHDACNPNPNLITRMKQRIRDVVSNLLHQRLAPQTSASGVMRYRTGTEFHIVDVRELQKIAPNMYDKVMAQVGKHCHQEFQDCDDAYLEPGSATNSLTDRVGSGKDYETTYVSIGEKFDHVTGETTLTWVATASQREYDNPAYPKYGEGWTADGLTKPQFRGVGHFKKTGAVVLSEASKHPELQGKSRLYAEDHNVKMYKRMKAKVEGTEKSQDDQGQPLKLTIMSMKTGKMQKHFEKLGITDLRQQEIEA